jgi:hypothetical protein
MSRGELALEICFIRYFQVSGIFNITGYHVLDCNAKSFVRIRPLLLRTEMWPFSRAHVKYGEFAGESHIK